jgi:UDP-GlcNAc3NAcA epimerase
MDMPEEINRILTDRISDLLCCPTEVAMENLNSEGFTNFPAKMVLTGDIMKESVTYFSKNIEPIYNFDYCLLTVHRQENTEDKERLVSIFKAMDDIAKSTVVICPLHPRTRKRLEDYGIESKVTFIDPVDYVKMQSLIHFSQIVITDSGGLQKEAYFHNKFSIILRDQTEWIELVNKGYAHLTGANMDLITSTYTSFAKLKIEIDSSLYGDEVGAKIFKEIKNLLWE